MKLSEIKGEKVFEVIADIIDPVSNIATDERAANLWKREKPKDGESVREFGMRKIKENLPYLLKAHKRDLVAVLAAVHGESVKVYSEKMNVLTLVQDATELLSDEVFQSLFTSAAQTMGGASSGSASENMAE